MTAPPRLFMGLTQLPESRRAQKPDALERKILIMKQFGRLSRSVLACLLVAGIMLSCVAPVAAETNENGVLTQEYEGGCVATYYATGRLVLSGSGSWNGGQPWYRTFNQTPTFVDDAGTSYKGSPITQVLVTEGVTSIPTGGFDAESSGTQWQVPYTISISSPLETIGGWAFADSALYGSISLPSTLKTIRQQAFYNTQITEITIPAGVTAIDLSTFANCTQLSSITLPEGLTNIGTSAFENCTSLTSIAIPETVTTFGSSIFRGCGLQSIVLPSNMTTIPYRMFADCTQLSNITIPDSVQYIQNEVFYNTNFRSIVIPRSVISIGEKAIGYPNPETFTIYGYRGTKAESYAAANGITFVPLDEADLRAELTADAWLADSICGTPRWPGSGLPAETVDNLWVKVSSSEGAIYSDVKLEITLPTGFSFQKNELVTTRTVYIGNLYGETSVQLPNIYPIYLSDASVGKQYRLTIQISGKEQYESAYTKGTSTPAFFKISNATHSAQASDAVMGNVTVPWDAALLSTEKSQNAAVLSAVLSQLAYDSEQCVQFLDALGFFGIESYGFTGVNVNACGRYIASKRVIAGDEIRNLVFTVVRGTTGAGEWLGNINVGDGDAHKSFAMAASYVEKDLSHYCASHGFQKKNTQFLVTGHSRGAATANLVAHWLNCESVIADRSLVSAYTFATPTVSGNISADTAQTDGNIHNYIFFQDVIRNAPSMQYYGRYGNVYIFGAETPPEDVSTWTDSFGIAHYVFGGYTESELLNCILYSINPRGESLTEMMARVYSMLKACLGTTGLPLGDFTAAPGAAHSMRNYLKAVQTGAAAASVDQVMQRTQDAYAYFLEHIFNPAIPDMAANATFVEHSFLGDADIHVYNRQDEEIASFTGSQIMSADDALTLYFMGDARVVAIPSELDGSYYFRAEGYTGGAIQHAIVTYGMDGAERMLLSGDLSIGAGESLLLDNGDGYAQYTDPEEVDAFLELLWQYSGKIQVVLPFSDVAESAWYYSAVEFAYENSLFAGATDITFAPNAPMTRAMLVAVLWRMDGRPVAGGVGTAFADVPDGQYYTEAVRWASENGIVAGVSETRFQPNGNITREQIAAIIYRYARFQGRDTSASADLSVFPDSSSVSDYAKTAISWANASGLISGIKESDGTVRLSPKGSATRAQVASILMRYLQNVAN